MRKAWISVAVLACLATAAMAAPGDSWTLPVAWTQDGAFTAYPGAGGDGTTAYEHLGTGAGDIARLYWTTVGTSMPATTELYAIEYYQPDQGASGWQPIESQFNGSAGETYPMEPGIPWAGAWGTNHQYTGSYGSALGTWNTVSDNHCPNSADYNAPTSPGGIYMWLKNGSYLYAKWDFGWQLNNTLGEIRLTQITPEPTSLLLLLLGAPLLRRRGS